MGSRGKVAERKAVQKRKAADADLFEAPAPQSFKIPKRYSVRPRDSWVQANLTNLLSDVCSHVGAMLEAAAAMLALRPGAAFVLVTEACSLNVVVFLPSPPDSPCWTLSAASLAACIASHLALCRTQEAHRATCRPSTRRAI